MEEDKKEKKGRIYRLMLDGARAVRARPTRKFERCACIVVSITRTESLMYQRFRCAPA